ncbi:MULTISPECIES: hypothetical protein [unclassified Synechocystis]|nr:MULTISPECIES: hypothetical protein [unclassified Synechocystis]NHL99720.1 hypothetical protein [Synechocystis sp. PCC 6803]QWO80518.1 hypothetical protein KBZ93_16305 [Synechocystis sp. PCC 6803]UOO11638.1 hypothetical protein MT986_16360 [Synechocystis sp. PCC 6803]
MSRLNSDSYQVTPGLHGATTRQYFVPLANGAIGEKWLDLAFTRKIFIF